MQGKSFSMAQTTSQAGLDCDGITPFYVFNAEKNGGFVIVSGDDRAKTILGYSNSGNLDLNNLPENVKWWLGFYTEAMVALENSAVKQKGLTQTAKSAISPLIKTKWNQGSPYNDQCYFYSPNYGYKYCLTGCVATATAQVVNYYKYPSNVKAMDGYSTSSYGYSVPALPETTLNWKNMTNDDIAKLNRYCGQSVQMDYSPNGSGAVTAQVAASLIKYFGYGNSTHAIIRDGFDPDEWENVIYNELKAKKPVIYAGHGGVGGHCFIIDGYKDGLFSVNWGWGGSCDGYFVLSILDSHGPNEPDWKFSENQLAIIGVKAKSGGTADFPIMTVSKMELLSANEVTRGSKSENFGGLQIAMKFDYTPNTDEAYMNELLALYKGDEFVSIIADFGYWMARPGYYWAPTYSNLSLGANLADGKYRIEGVYKDANGNIKKAQGSDYRYVEAVIKGNKLTLTNYPLIGAVKLNKTKATIAKGKTVTLKATVTPSTVEDKSVTWKSSDKSVATVTSAGKVKGVKAGTATITCTSSTGLKATCKVTVADLTLSATETSLEKGKTMTLKATVLPSSISDKSVTWTSSNTKIATVTSAGKVKGVKAGTATITCTSTATGATATCKVTITNGTVTLNKTEVALLKGKTVTLKATVTPSSLKDKSVTWKSSDTKIATVTSAGKVKAVKEGIATITCTSKATGMSATCKVIVGKVVINVDEITLKKTREITLVATVYPTSLTDKSVTWKSSDTKIATVTSDGKVKGIKAGTVTITCTSKATGLSGTCKVKVLSTAGSRSTEGDNDDTTGIKQLNENTVEPFDVYNLSGRKVLNKVTSMDGLPAGVYIVNGKKVLKKK